MTPSITPALFRPNDPITVTYDVTGTPLANLASAWIWVWSPNPTVDSKYNINPASSNAAQTNNAKFTKTVSEGHTYFSITFTPASFFTQDISSRTKLGMLLKGNDWANGQSTDYVTDFWDGNFQMALTSPLQQPLFVSNGEEIEITAETPIAADYELYINEALVDEQDGVTAYSYTHTVTETSGYALVELVAAVGENSDEASFQYIVSSGSQDEPRPAGIIPGINYNPNDNTKVILCLLAPDKNSVYVRGDFSDWRIYSENQMKKDGEFFWLEIEGLTPGEEYAYQYLVDETLWLADPYADKVLDPDDQYITEDTYPDLKPFPEEALNSESKWYFNRLSVFQTDQEPYDWQVTDFEKPAKEELVIYELLIRDFFEEGDNNYQALIDTISYFRRLGVNAIELMPIMEFGGNNSWGYNPQFMFAPDKAYGPKNKLKEFIDVCHQNGIAVILDIAMNHQDTPNPYLLMDFDFTALPVPGKPTANNKWFNVNATHPFNVFFDMNHESQYTKDYLDTINHYWLNEYKIDGYRFDLSKGFTQVNNPGNVDAWSAYDASRISILKRMADEIWNDFPDAYVILEHLAVNSEEKELAEYGMMLWGKMNDPYQQNAMGYSENSNIIGVYYGSRGWTVPHLVSYMESHDEERMMFKNIEYGNAAGNYDVTQEHVSVNRVKAASTIFYTIPGPKMLWQFGELGYDYSINYCEDNGENEERCRTYPKPVRWDYREDYGRYSIYTHISDLLRLRNEYDVFTSGTATIALTTDPGKQVVLKNNPYTATPSDADDMNAVVVVNFDVASKAIAVEFPHTGTWYDYYLHGTEVNVNVAPFQVQLPPGQFKIYTDVAITNPVITDVLPEVINAVSVYPNPVQDVLTIGSEEKISGLKIHTLHGLSFQVKQLSSNTWDVSTLPDGVYVAEVRTNTGSFKIKVIKNQQSKN